MTWQPPPDTQAALDFIGQQFPLQPTVENLARVPQARVYNSAGLTVASGAWAALTFDSERIDYTPPALAGPRVAPGAGQHTLGDSKLTCRVPGLYLIGGNVSFAANATGRRGVRITAAGADVAMTLVPAPATGSTVLNVSCLTRLAAGDTAELGAYQDSGGTLTAQATGNTSPEFYWTWISQ